MEWSELDARITVWFGKKRLVVVLRALTLRAEHCRLLLPAIMIRALTGLVGVQRFRLTRFGVGTFNKKIGVFDLDGKALGPAQVNGEIGGIQGLATAPNGDVWACDNQLNQMIRFPGGGSHKRRNH